MAGGKLTPRQKMINMMYIVLIALLAMNVSSEVLEAFGRIEEGIDNSNTVLKEKIISIDEALKVQANEKPDEAKPLLEKSQQVTQVSKELRSFINDLKKTLLSSKFAGENEDLPGTVKKLDDIDSPTRLLADDASANTDFKGKTFQDKINQAKQKFLDIVNDVDGITDEDIAKLEESFTLMADDFEGKSAPKDKWYSQFHHVPASGTMAMLTKIENDALSTEAVINEFLLNRVGKLSFKIDKLRATVQAEKAYLPGGAQYESTIFLTASSTDLGEKTYVGSLNWDLFKVLPDSLGGGYEPWNDKKANKLGKTPFKGDSKLLPNGQYKGNAAVGQNRYEGAIKIKSPAGGFDWYPFKGSYEGAAAGGFSASPTKMNVLYIGVDNPMSITVGDAKPGTERASLSGGSISKRGNEWIAKVSKQGKAILSASGNTPDGKPTKTFTAEFRVKRIPDPIPTLGGRLTGGNIKAGTLRAQSGIIASLKDFDFDARFTVVSYDFMLVPKGGDILPARGIKGASLSGKVKNLLGRARSKDMVIFNKIKVRGPDGTTRTLPSLTFNVI